MGKNNVKVQPRRVSHSAHMPRYRMNPRDKVAKLLKTLQLQFGSSICRGSDLKPKKVPSWFQQRCAAKKTIAKLAGNRLVLIDNGFRGMNRRHWFYHRDCGNNLYLSPDYIVQVGCKNVCPYCQGAQDLKACGTGDLLQKFIFNHSGQNCIAILRQDLEFVGDDFAFYCLIHQSAYASSFKSFLETASITNGCPRCREETAGFVKKASKQD